MDYSCSNNINKDVELNIMVALRNINFKIRKGFQRALKQVSEVVNMPDDSWNSSSRKREKLAFPILLFDQTRLLIDFELKHPNKLLRTKHYLQHQDQQTLPCLAALMGIYQIKD